MALGWQSTDKRTKDKADQASAASPTDLQRFVGQLMFLITVLFSLAKREYLILSWLGLRSVLALALLCQPRDNKTFKIRCVRKLVSLFVFPFVMCRKGPFYKPIPLPPSSLLAPNCLKCRGACFLKMSTPFAYTVSSLSNFFSLSFRSAKYNAKTAISTYVTRVQTTPFRQLPTPYSPTSAINPCWTAKLWKLRQISIPTAKRSSLHTTQRWPKSPARYLMNENL